MKEALQGTQLRKNQTHSIPVPWRDEVAKEALNELEEDITTRSGQDIGELEQEIDEAVFDLYEFEDENVQKHINSYVLLGHVVGGRCLAIHSCIQFVIPPIKILYSAHLD